MTAIEVNDLTKRYGRRTVVDGVSLRVEAGEIFGIVGPNGAGKTTTMECVAGLREPDAGVIRVLGLDPRRDRAGIRARVGVQLQESALPDRLRVGEALDLFASFYPKPRDWRELLDDLGLAEQERMPFAKLSGGQRQRLSVALALVGSPEVALLDELTTGLDPQGRREVWTMIRRLRDQGLTIVIVTHLAEEAQRLCDRIAVLHRGRIVATDTPAALIERAGRIPGVDRPTLDDAIIALTDESFVEEL